MGSRFSFLNWRKLKECHPSIGLLGLALLLTGCGLGHDMYKPSILASTEWKDSCFDSSHYFVESGSGLAARENYVESSLISDPCLGRDEQFSIGVIEFDDEGAHWDRRQLTQVQEEIERITRQQVDGDLSTQGILLVVFVHGWRHNASEGSRNLLDFRKMVVDLATPGQQCSLFGREGCDGHETKDDDTPEYHVLGVYLGWRGDSAGLTNTWTRDSKLGEQLKKVQLATFWHRKSAARRVAGTAMTETLLSLLDTLEQQDLSRFNAAAELEQPINSSSRSLIIGHSFGARVVEHSVAQAFVAKRLEVRRLFEDKFFGIGRIESQITELKELISTNSTNKKQFLAQQASSLESAESAESRAADLKKKIDKANADLAAQSPSVSADERSLSQFGSLTEVGRVASTCLQADLTSALQQCKDQHSEDVDRAQCVVSAARCEYDRYICVAKHALDPEETSCVLPTDTTLPELDDDDKKSNWQAFAKDLKKYRDALGAPLDKPQFLADSINDLPGRCDDIYSDGRFDQDSNLALALRQFSNTDDADLRPLIYFEPGSAGRIDSTELFENELLSDLDTAKKALGTYNKQAKNQLQQLCAAQWRLWKNKEEIDQRDDWVAQRDVAVGEGQTHRTAAEQAGKQATEAKKGLETAETTRKKVIDEVKFRLDRLMRPPADLVVLLNPATEAMSALSLINAMCAFSDSDLIEQYALSDTRDLRPWVVSVTSTGDSATKRMFPMGVTVGRWLTLAAPYRENNPDQDRSACDHYFGAYRKMLTKTAGHSDSIYSHELIDVDDVTPGDGSNVLNLQLPVEDGRMLTLRQKRDSSNRSEYWIFSAPPEVIDDHNDIFNTAVTSLLVQLMKVSEFFKPKCPEYDTRLEKCVADLKSVVAEN